MFPNLPAIVCPSAARWLWHIHFDNGALAFKVHFCLKSDSKNRIVECKVGYLNDFQIKCAQFTSKKMLC